MGAKLKSKITTQVNAEVKKHNVLKNIERDLTLKEKKRLAPQVKARIEKELTAKETPKVQGALLDKTTKAVNAQKDKIMLTLKKALIAKAKADQTPAMQKKLDKEIPAALKSSKFLADVRGQQEKLKETLKARMHRELRKPREQATKMKYKRMAKEKSTKITNTVTKQKDIEMRKVMSEALKTSRLKKDVEKDLTAAKAATLKKLTKTLTKKLLDQAKEKMKPVLDRKIKGSGSGANKTPPMKASDAASVKFQMMKAAKVKAEKDARLQAIIEMKSKLAKQLEKELLSKEKKKVKKAMQAKIAEKLTEKATMLAKKALAAKLKDTMEAMEKGKNHVMPKKQTKGLATKDRAPSAAKTAAKDNDNKANAAASASSLAKKSGDLNKSATAQKVTKSQKAAAKVNAAKAKAGAKKEAAKNRKKVAAKKAEAAKKTIKKVAAKTQKAEKKVAKANAKVAKKAAKADKAVDKTAKAAEGKNAGKRHRRRQRRRRPSKRRGNPKR